MASKIILCIFVFTLATLVKADGSLKVGHFTKDSKLIYHGNFDAMGIFFIKRTETFDIRLTDGGKIKAIDIQDMRGDSSSWILGGGVGHDFVTIKLESKRGSGYNFVIDVYGYDDEGTGNKKKKPAEKPAKVTTKEPAEEPAREPAEEPAEEPAGEFAEEPAENPAGEPVKEPAEEPAEKLESGVTVEGEKDEAKDQTEDKK